MLKATSIGVDPLSNCFTLPSGKVIFIIVLFNFEQRYLDNLSLQYQMAFVWLNTEPYIICPSIITYYQIFLQPLNVKLIESVFKRKKLPKNLKFCHSEFISESQFIKT